MSNISSKVNINNEDFMINVLNNIPEEYNVILDVLNNVLMSIGTDALIRIFEKN